MQAKTVLVVDDDVAVCDHLAAILDQAGYSVLSASNGSEALERMRSSEPALVLLDMVMPAVDIDGWQVLETRQKDSALQRIPVIIVTALEVASKEWAEMLGAVEIIRKPVKVERLLDAVEQFTL